MRIRVLGIEGSQRSHNHPHLNVLSMQIINNQSKNRGVFYSSQTENYSPEDSFLVALGIYPREAWFSAVLYLIRTKNIKHDRGTFLQVFKKKKKRQISTSSESVRPWCREGILIIKGILALMSQEVGHLSLSSKQTFFTSGQCTLFFNG